MEDAVVGESLGDKPRFRVSVELELRFIGRAQI
jgi:hypothetical protein